MRAALALAGVLALTSPVHAFQWPWEPRTLECRTQWCGTPIPGYEATWDRSRGLRAMPAPEPPPPPIHTTSVAHSWGELERMAMGMRPGRCAYVEWDGRAMLVKGDRTMPEGVGALPRWLVRQAEAQHCADGIEEVTHEDREVD